MSAEPPNVLENSRGVPRLKFLSVRSADRPIDLQPAFARNHFIYKASLDYFLGNFQVDAFPASGMEIIDVLSLQTSRDILPGDTHEVTITVQDPDNHAKMRYTVAVERLNGNDVTIHDLKVDGAIISPVFEPSRLDYRVRLRADQDCLNLHFIPWDVGQVFEVSASSVTSGRILYDGNLEGISGEVQRYVVTRRFRLEIGGSRLITIVVKPANGDLMKHRTYTLTSMRDACPPHRPYFAPDVHACAVTCNEGYFPSKITARCEVCSGHCLKCSAWDKCDICEPSNWRIVHLVKLFNGRCYVLAVPWLQLIVACASCVICLSVCCCLGCCSCCDCRRRGPPGAYRPKAKEMEQYGQESHRLLPRYDDTWDDESYE